MKFPRGKHHRPAPCFSPALPPESSQTFAFLSSASVTICTSKDMGTHVAAYRAANGSAVKGESWKPSTPEENQLVSSLPADQNIMVILGDVEVKDSKDVVYDNLTVFEGPVTVQRVDAEKPVPAKKDTSDDNVKYLPETSSDPCGFGSCAFRWAIGLSIAALVVIAIIVSVVSTLGEKDELVTRERWGGMPPKHPADNLTLPTPFVIISHTATDFCSTLEECSAVVRSVQNYHMDSRKWWDIGYNFLVGGDGRAYEGRGWDAVGAHARSYNNVSIGLSFIGTFMDVEPTEAQVKAAMWLIGEGVRLGKIAEDYVLLAHRQISSTESPGEKLFQMMKHWPHWSEFFS